MGEVLKREQFSFTDVDVSPERRILTNLITRTEFLREYTSDSFHFETPVAGIIAQWVREYFNEYNQSPGSYIEQIFLEKKENMRSGDIEEVGRLLKSLSDTQNGEFNLEYELRSADTFFKKRALTKLKDKLIDHIGSGDLEAALHSVTGYKSPGRDLRIGVDFLSDPMAIDQAFADETPHLFKYDDAVGKVVGGIYPGEVTGLMARTGFGKTWWLLYTAMLATRSGYDTLFVSLEMSKDEVLKRAWQMRLQRGALNDFGGYTEISIFEETAGSKGNTEEFTLYNDHGKKEPKFYRPVLHNVPVTPITAEEAKQHQKELKLMWQEREMKIWAYPTGTLTIAKLRGDVDNERQKYGFKPRVIVVDYPRILSKAGNDEYRLRIENLWIELKQWASEENIAIVGGLQVTGDKLSSGHRPSMESIPEAKAINNHVASLFTLWDAAGDSAQNLLRISNLKSRFAQRSNKDAIVSYSYRIGQPHVASILSSQLSI